MLDSILYIQDKDRPTIFKIVSRASLAICRYATKWDSDRRLKCGNTKTGRSFILISIVHVA